MTLKDYFDDENNCFHIDILEKRLLIYNNSILLPSWYIDNLIEVHCDYVNKCVTIKGNCNNIMKKIIEK